MTDQGFRFCPRCGTALVAALPYCPKCGFNVAEIGGSGPPEPSSDAPVVDPYDWSKDAAPTATEKPVRPDVPGSRPVEAEPPRRSRGTPIIIGGLVVAAAVVAYGLFSRPGTGADPSAAPGGSQIPGAPAAPGQASAAPSAPIVGITIQSPQDGQSVATGEVTVIGIAPPGLTITRDISFGLDQHTTVDGTGHWAMGVRLEQGENVLVFRIGDDRSTERKLTVTFVAPAQ
jgi:hypothetical protein